MSSFKKNNMKFHIFFILICSNIFAQIGIGTTQPDPSSILDVYSENAGFLPPRLTEIQRDAINSPAEGLLVYNTDIPCIQIYSNSEWKCLDFAGNSTIGCTLSGLGIVNGPTRENAPIVFSVNNPGQGFTYDWTFPSGSPSTSTAANPTVTWSSSGTYTVTVNITDAFGCTASLSTSITVSSCSTNPSANFTALGNSAGMGVTFIPTDNAVGNSYAWQFTSGTPATSNLKNPIVIWSALGSYNVTLVVTDINGCSNTSVFTVNIDDCTTVSYVFNSCGATGPEGPNQAQCDAAYGAGVVTVAGGIQQWIVPESGRYSISMAGAAGAGSTAPNTGQGGAGGSASGELFLSQGTILYISVGQKGIQQSVSSTSGGFNGGGNGGNSNCTTCYGYGGGGGTDVRLGGSGLGNRILVAGGGGAGGSNGISASRGMAGGGGGGGYYGGGGAGSWTGNLPQSGVFGIGGNGVNANLNPTGNATSGNGGNGGGNTGTDGIDGSANIGSRGRAGTQSAGGAAGGCITSAISGAGPGGGGGGSGYFNPSVVTNGSTSTGTNTGNGWVTITRLCLN